MAAVCAFARSTAADSSSLQSATRRVQLGDAAEAYDATAGIRILCSYLTHAGLREYALRPRASADLSATSQRCIL